MSASNAGSGDVINQNGNEKEVSMFFTEKKKPRHQRRPGLVSMALMGVLLLVATGCDSLLEVDLPGQMEEAGLNDPGLAETLVLGAQADFECGLAYFTWGTAVHTDELDTVSNWRNINIWGARLVDQRGFGGTPHNCNPGNASVVSTWLPLQTARFMANGAVERIDGFPVEEVDQDVNYLKGWARAYAGYSVLLLSEAFCSVTFDVGPEMTREQGFEKANDIFSEALQLLQGVDTPQAESLRYMALVGRARANLNLGNAGQVEADASLVPKNFVRYSTHSTTSSRRWNMVHRTANVERDLGVSERFRNLEVDGVPDPRVPHADRDGVGSDGFSPYWPQLKYTSNSDDIPFASGREALLMLAEVRGGQEAVNIINELRADHGLPEFSSDDDLEIMAQVMDERRRELWLQATRIGDLLRFDDAVLDALDLNWEAGSNNKGEAFGPNTCIPLMDAEIQNNPNL